jgi:hypothetical protein
MAIMQDELPIYELKISEADEGNFEVDYIALVDRPAIQRNFQAFADQFVEPGESETQEEFIGRCIPAMIGEGYEQDQAAAICYTKWRDRDGMGEDFEESIKDIPDDVRANARNAVEWADKNGWGSCGTPVGKRRASQLADPSGAVSLDTVRRMYSFLSRHEKDLESSKGYSDGCGKLMYDAWGGKAGLRWSRNVLRQASEVKLAIQDSAQRIVSGALMIPDKLILRRDAQGEYFIKFSPETIKQIAIRFAKQGYQRNVNLQHDKDQRVDAVLFESWVKDSERGIGGMKGYEDLPDGTWFGSMKITDDEGWAKVEAGEVKGFSVEGIFQYERAEQTKDEEIMARIIDILQSIG